MMSLALGASLPAVAFASAGLTPPSLAPILAADVDTLPYTVNLEWTASNKTDSAGFGYVIESSRDGVSFNRDVNVTTLDYDYNVSVGDEGAWYFKVTPYNDAGDGPSSNIANVEIPGT
jgi:hypothetical protein